MADHSTSTPQSQGDRFERTFLTLVETLIRDDLGLDVIHASRQPPGSQRGKDLQVKWRNQHGIAREWHFECKSHLGPTLAAKEIGDKLLQVACSLHGIDVWCLALANAEPSTDIDEVFASAPTRLAFDFALAVLSPRRAFIKQLYACHPELYRDQYDSEPPTLTIRERESTVRGFGAWLESESSRRADSRLPVGWQAVSPTSLNLGPDNPAAARGFLRGLTLTCPWEAIAYGWAVPRPSAERPILTLIQDAPPGIAYDWLVGAGGEGKSTILKRLSWSASTGSNRRVLWTDDTVPSSVPLDWILSLPHGSTVLLCVDGTRQFDGLKPALRQGDIWAREEKSIIVLLSDRSHHWQRSRRRLNIGRAAHEPRFLAPLADQERRDLISALDARGLLFGKTVSDANSRLTTAAEEAAKTVGNRRAERSWLLPTVMQLTDPTDRPFDAILTSVVADLEGAEVEAVRLLFGVSLVDAAGAALPVDLARRLLGGPDKFLTAYDAAIAELERQFDASLGLRNERLEESLRTHSRVVSEGIVRVALAGASSRSRLLLVCRDLPLLLAPDYTRTALLPKPRFDLLDLLTNYLDSETGDYEAATEILASWIELDGTAYAAWHRLGEARMHWLKRDLREGAENRERLLALADAARNAFRRSLTLSMQVLSATPRPLPYTGADLDRHWRVTHHAWALLEAVIGTPASNTLGDRDNLVRAAHLAILSLRGADTEQIDKSCGLLTQILINLQLNDIAAALLAAKRSVARDGDHVVRRCEKQLAERGVRIPKVGLEVLDQALARISIELISKPWIPLNDDSDENQERSSLRAALTEIGSTLSDDKCIRRAIPSI
jgi:hypothetical protein